MELTPQAVSDAEFREAKRGGYNIRDVDDFLDQVAIGVGQMQERIRDAYQRAEAAESRLGELQHQLEEARQGSARVPDGAGAAHAGGETDETLRRTLVLAQRTADATISEAKEEAARIVQQAREEASRSRPGMSAAPVGDVSAVRDDVGRELDHLAAQRDHLREEIDRLEAHLDTQRENLRSDLEELQQLLDDPATLRMAPPPQPRAEPAYDPPAYDPPAYDPPAFEPPSFAPPPEPAEPFPGANGHEPDNGFVPGTRLSSDAISPAAAPNPRIPAPADMPPAAFEPPDAMPPPAEPAPPPGDLFGEPERPPLPSRDGGSFASPFEPPPGGPFGAPPQPSPSPFEPPSGGPFGAPPQPSPSPFEPPPGGEPLPGRDPLPSRGSLPAREPTDGRDPLPRRDGVNVAALQELHSSPGQDGAPPEDAGRSLFPSSLGPPPSPGATGFFPDLNPAEPGTDARSSEAPAFSDVADDGLPLPIDAPPPPPPPPGLEHLRDAGGIPVDGGNRPSEWGRGVFDDEDEEGGTRFGRSG